MSNQPVIDGVNQIDGGAPAFPVSISGAGDNGWHGMSLRDYFAGQAIASIPTRSWDHLGSDAKMIAAWAECAYAVADAMIAARASLSASNRGEGK